MTRPTASSQLCCKDHIEQGQLILDAVQALGSTEPRGHRDRVGRAERGLEPGCVHCVPSPGIRRQSDAVSAGSGNGSVWMHSLIYLNLTATLRVTAMNGGGAEAHEGASISPRPPDLTQSCRATGSTHPVALSRKPVRLQSRAHRVAFCLDCPQAVPASAPRDTHAPHLYPQARSGPSVTRGSKETGSTRIKPGFLGWLSQVPANLCRAVVCRPLVEDQSGPGTQQPTRRQPVLSGPRTK